MPGAGGALWDHGIEAGKDLQDQPNATINIPKMCHQLTLRRFQIPGSWTGSGTGTRSWKGHGKVRDREKDMDKVRDKGQVQEQGEGRGPGQGQGHSLGSGHQTQPTHSAQPGTISRNFSSRPFSLSPWFSIRKSQVSKNPNVEI